jgi:hypothetical protein
MSTVIFGLPHVSAAAVNSQAARCSPRLLAKTSSIARRARRYYYGRYVNGGQTGAKLHAVATNRVLVDALISGDLPQARAEADRMVFAHTSSEGVFFDHVVRIRFTSGADVLIDSNSSNFAVAGPSVLLRRPDGSLLGRLSVSVQDQIGFLKIIHGYDNVALFARSQSGLLASVPSRPYEISPVSGCSTVLGITYAVRSLDVVSFTGEPVRIFVWASSASHDRPEA